MDTTSRNHQDALTDRTGNGIIAKGNENLTYEAVSETMFRARTLEQIAAAWKVRSEYLRANPDDEAILEEGESLWMREQALKYPDTPARQAERAA